jgi:hypothetical protein
LKGVVTSGGSAIRSAAAKTEITVVSEGVKNTFDTKTTSNGIEKPRVNSASNVIKNTAIGLSVGAVTTKAKVKVATTTSANKLCKAHEQQHILQVID